MSTSTTLTLVTGNEGKAREYSALLGIDVAAVKTDLEEIQELDVVAVVRHKVTNAYSKLGTAVLVDDTGLTVDAWNGFPGALIAWLLKARGVAGILEWAATLTDRRTTVTTAIGYADAEGVRIFTGALHGTLATEPRGVNGFGYDSVFIPDGEKLTYAEMTPEYKNTISHRRLAVDELRKGLDLPVS
ncbi:non-canonical purine NTP pyrophosphatase [Saccharopolyspora shandongensis]|uniref:non-canonical purine NTP pyrophosphatase n=1 Tax=Saccharopolyspora shandongensis TaxID=418495 RepID=UPI0034170CB2